MSQEVYANCDRCGCAIHFGDTHATIDRMVQRIDRTDSFPKGEVIVSDDVVVLTSCGACESACGLDDLDEALASFRSRSEVQERTEAPSTSGSPKRANLTEIPPGTLGAVMFVGFDRKT